MYYKIVNRLPKDAVCSEHYEFPFKFAKSLLYVYEPGIYLGDAVWYRRSYRLDCHLAKYLQFIVRCDIVRRTQITDVMSYQERFNLLLKRYVH